MATLGLWLLSVGLSDVTFGLLAGRRTFVRLVAGLVVAGLVAGAGARAVDFQVIPSLVLTVWTGLTTLAWQGLRGDEARVSATRAVFALTAVVLLGLATFLSLGVWPDPASGLAGRFLRLTPFPVLARMTPGKLVLAVGILVALVETGNAAVRLVLTATGVSPSRAGARLRGGRILGPVERLLIFGFAVAGEITGAALVASAKSILRFPEISRVSAQSGVSHQEASELAPDEISEYVLIGSLVSWFLALLPVLLLAG